MAKRTMWIWVLMNVNGKLADARVPTTAWPIEQVRAFGYRRATLTLSSPKKRRAAALHPKEKDGGRG